MAVQLNHTIVPARDDEETARFLTEVLGLAAPVRSEPFLVVRLANDVAMDVMRIDGPVPTGHYAFLVGDEEFDEILGRIQDRGITYWADPFHRHGRPRQRLVRRPGRLLRGPERPQPGDHDPRLRRQPLGRLLTARPRPRGRPRPGPGSVTVRQNPFAA